MPCADKGKDEVQPEINQSNSATTARRKTRLVVKRGSTRIGGSPGLVEGIEREKRRGCGAKIEYVPVPVLQVQELRTLNRLLRFFEEIAKRQLPIWTVFTLSNNTVDKIQVLVFFMVWREDHRSHCSLNVCFGVTRRDWRRVFGSRQASELIQNLAYAKMRRNATVLGHIPADLMPLEKPLKPSNLQVISIYSLNKVHPTFVRRYKLMLASQCFWENCHPLRKPADTCEAEAATRTATASRIPNWKHRNASPRSK
jgi:hypothetical protein